MLILTIKVWQRPGDGRRPGAEENHKTQRVDRVGQRRTWFSKEKEIRIGLDKALPVDNVLRKGLQVTGFAQKSTSWEPLPYRRSG